MAPNPPARSREVKEAFEHLKSAIANLGLAVNEFTGAIPVIPLKQWHALFKQHKRLAATRERLERVVSKSERNGVVPEFQ